MLNKYWDEAIVTTNYLQNRLPSLTKEKTPFEYWIGEKPDFKSKKISGSQLYALIPNELRCKLNPKARKLCLIGYCEKSKAY